MDGTRMNLQVTETEEDGVWIIGLKGEVDYAAVLETLAEVMERAWQNCLKIIVDLSLVSLIDSEGIKILLKTLKQLRKVGGALWLIYPEESLTERIFHLAGLTSMFNSARDKSVALAALQQAQL